jgi:uncharacterized protein with ParB-like and HNH nuclease domain
MMDETKNNPGYPVKSGIVCLRDFFDKTSKKVLEHQEDRYEIPYYQRPYEWEWKDKQLKGLVGSFINLSYGKSEDDDENKRFLFKPDHYVVFGTIQINKKGENYEIIDGQQRIVSFWILLKAINVVCDIEEEDNLSFEVKNQIGQKYQEQFDDFWNSEEKNRYAENYRTIKKTLEEIDDTEKLKGLKNYILDKVLFSLMLTSFDDNVDETIDLFNTLNTTGLDLGMKDKFKIKYFEFLKKNLMETYSEKEAKEIFTAINNAYERCKDKKLDPVFEKDENTLIDTFKLWILLKDSDFRKTQLPEKIKASNNAFFVEGKDGKYSVWNKKLEGKEDVRSRETFCGIAETIYQTQIIMQELSKNPGENFDEIKFLLCSDELLINCGYWYLRNLFYVFTHAIRMDKNENAALQEDDVFRALRLCMKIWKICSIWKTTDTRVKNQCFNDIANNIASVFVDDPRLDISNLKCKEILYSEYINKFKDVISGNESVFDNRQCWFFNVLTYIGECKTGSDLCEVRRRIFHNPEKKEERFEIEHIASKAVCNGTDLEKYMNHIGNLVFLNNSINSKLGARTKSLENKSISLDDKLVKDFAGKINESGTSYWDDVKEDENHKPNVAIRQLLESIPEEYTNGSKSMDVKMILETIVERDKKLQKDILTLYSDVV